MARESAGKGRCAMCGEVIVWRKNPAGTLSYFCQECDFQGYAKPGTRANRLALEEVAKFQGPATVAKPETKPATPAAVIPPAPATKPNASGLLLG